MNLAEGVQIVSFGLLALLSLGAALGVVLLTNIVYSAFLLGAVFMGVAGMYLLLNADFVAAAQVLIYVGSVNVLILFGIMLVNKQQDFKALPNIQIRRLATAGVCTGLFALLGTMVFSTPWSTQIVEVASSGSSIVTIAQHFFSDFLLPFELASVFLLMAMVGAIVLARRDFIPDTELTQAAQPPVWTLQERPRELLSVSTDNSSDQS
ncbi:MAG: NADH-quinone oxidoreductase subunit J [Oscillatoriales cyanobacterium RM2_1_1]|nr:NADH-quinone oxidoreductase subunit J [Oscillatoriales cyanobacterium SM2_3_0]NJO44513.1 NADH-quinone oxidoreductase subunit J [Oscillatoriales cyanobacterium RM2_1_1]